MTYTPGPWKMQRYSDTISIGPDANYHGICVALTEYGGVEEKDGWKREIRKPIPNAEENALLILAAPESHEANILFMKGIEDEYRFYPSAGDDFIHDTIGSALSTAYFAARAAVAKVKGDK